MQNEDKMVILFSSYKGKYLLMFKTTFVGGGLSGAMDTFPANGLEIFNDSQTREGYMLRVYLPEVSGG